MREARAVARALSRNSDRALLQLATLPLGEPAPDPEPLVVHQRGVQTLGPDLAGQADLLGLPGGTALLGEERLGVRLRAQRALLPPRVVGVVPVQEKEFSHVTRPSTHCSTCVVEPSTQSTDLSEMLSSSQLDQRVVWISGEES